MKPCIFLSFLLFFASTCFSKTESIETQGALKNTQEIEQLLRHYLKPKAVLNSSYDEFKFASYQGALFNLYSGHTNFNGIGAENLRLGNFYWGLNLYNITTNTDSNSRITNALNQNHGSIEDNGVYFHVLKQITSLVFLDVFANFGRDRFRLINTVTIDGNTPLTGYAKYYGNDNTVGVRTFLGQTYKLFYLQGDLTFLYSNFNQPDYILTFPDQPVGVPALTTKIGTLVEHARLYYQVNEHFSPFLNGGLIQLTSRSFSRPVLGPDFVTIAPLPQLLLAKNGYSYGIGFDYLYKLIRITPIYAHTVRGNSFSDDYVGVKLELKGTS
ncbi:hypothetical protein [Legionella pneumophila]|uniref:hypothetical protein n=1 Tax=Legionella pneumophila TaxID=446 RepID=UPI00026DA21E|nr:hypothetical protein [Legionella pneumophila]CCD07590.1 conserved exported protein of unknown function [Legionella pneumophila subsp. pneumophila]CZG99218.1 Uncharacterised protein [Legionella pneumophila]CZJ77453.1 Uncharacterised protein [Legionella pneumophila]CZR10095.1 Uncharacterised protein [Legionella pneumophila]STX65593.1 Uncharacterised protein [Legionella pneumophila]